MKRVRLVALLPTLAVCLVLSWLVVPAISSATTLPHVMVESVHASPSALPPGGGKVQVTGTVQHADSCQLQLLSPQRLLIVYPHNPTTACRNGRYSASVVIGANPSTVNRTISLALVARNGSSSFSAGFYVVLGALSRPTVLSVSASPDALPPGGGEVTVTSRVKHASSCQLELLSSQSFPVVYSHDPKGCADGYYSARVVIGSNPSPITRTVAFALVARNTATSLTAKFHVVLAAPAPVTTTTTTPPPSTTTTTAPLAITTQSLPNGSVGAPYLFTLHAEGGTPPYAWLVNNGSLPPGLNLNAKGVVTGTPTVGGDFTVPIEVVDTPGDIDISNLDVAIGGGSGSTTTTTTTVPPTTATVPPTTTTTTPVQATSIAVSLSVSPSDGTVSASLTGSYTATASATCGYSDGSTGPCSLPDGSISWQALGGDVGGNFMYPSTPFTACSGTVGPATTTNECDVNWNSYGNQWLSATYNSSPSDQLASPLLVSYTLPVKITAPVDLGAGFTYGTYDNTGPQGIGDCTMAAAADWIQTTFGTAPSTEEVVNDYWAAEDQFNGGADEGLSITQLFSYWQSDGIGGTTLTGVNPISMSDVESELSDNYVLFATAALPAGYPLGDGQGGGHAWLVVGYSSFGPMIVSWGQEVQVSWANFDNWTTGVWALGASQT